MQTTTFRFSLIMMKKVLSLLAPADAIFQGRKTGLSDAMEVIDSVLPCLHELRNWETYNAISKEAESLHLPVAEPRAKRIRLQSTRLQDSVVMENIGEKDDNMERVLYETVDLVCNEMERRFSNNSGLLKAIASVNLLDEKMLEPLTSLGIPLPSHEELVVVKDYLRKRGNAVPFEEVSLISIF
jgi:hypothetical protein